MSQQEMLLASPPECHPGQGRILRVVDYDQRRVIAIETDGSSIPLPAVYQHVGNYLSQLTPDIDTVVLSSDGKLIAAAKTPENLMDKFFGVYHPTLGSLQNEHPIQTVDRTELKELVRMGPNVDIVVSPNSSNPDAMLVFKYYFVHLQYSIVWNELSVRMRLPEHPFIVSFDKIVVDEIDSRIVGFTTEFIPAGALDQKPKREFKVKWIYQLMMVVDELNLVFGIAHQDIARENLVINEASDSLMISDLKYASPIGGENYDQTRNDINGVLFTVYEIITRDTSYRTAPCEANPVPSWQNDTSAIEEKLDWVQHPDVYLDWPAGEIRTIILTWAKERRAGNQLDPETFNNTFMPNAVTWPSLPVPMAAKHHQLPDAPRRWKNYLLRQCGQDVLDWHRPPSRGFHPWPLDEEAFETKSTRS